MKITQYQVDAFARRVFEGNPAAVCPLDAWLSDELLQNIAEENNLSETAFFVPAETGFQLRWFTPVAEVDLCGHATLASAHVLFEILGYPQPAIEFETRSGKLIVERKGGLLAMDFPARPPQACAPPLALIEGLGRPSLEVLAADDLSPSSTMKPPSAPSRRTSRSCASSACVASASPHRAPAQTS
jgi:predicted PhzF superfamily epimerase YddE/YHI9